VAGAPAEDRPPRASRRPPPRPRRASTCPSRGSPACPSTRSGPAREDW
jgi:hypothetical protein